MNPHRVATALATLLLAVLSVLAGSGGLAGCGVPAEDTPRTIEPPPGPYLTTPEPPPGTAPAGIADEELCLVRDAKLVRVVRKVAAPPTAQTLLAHLIAGPTPQERDAGLTSALTGSGIITVQIENDQARVDVPDGDTPGRDVEVLAYGQIVCTLTTGGGVATVQFERDGKPFGVPRADGSLADGPVTAADYASLFAGS